MKYKIAKSITSEIYARSREGLWVKARLVDSGIELLWQVRTSISHGKLISYDFNGNVESLCDINIARYENVMKSAGIVPIYDDFVSFCGVDKFDIFVESIMNHMVNMAISGYGEDPGEIIDWYSNISEMKFMDGTRFKFYRDCEPFCDMYGLMCDVSVIGDKYEAVVDIRDNKVNILISDKDLISFIISTIPV